MYMTKENRMKIILLAIICIIALAMGAMNKNYLVTGMYILTLVPVAYFMKDDDTYSLLYGILLVSTFYDYVLYVPGIKNAYMFHIVLALFTLMTLYKIIKDRRILFNIDRRILTIYVIWFIYMCISVVWALNKQLSVKYIAIYILMFCFILNVMIYNTNKERFNKTITLLIGLLSLIIIIGFGEVLFGQLPVVHHYDGLKVTNLHDFNALRARPIVFSFNTNNLAAALGILTPICFFSINRFENILLKVYFAIISIMGFTLVILTSSRTGLVSVTFGLFVYLLYCIFSIKKIGIKALIFPIVLILGLTFSYYNAYKILRTDSMGSEEFTKQNDMSTKMNVLVDADITYGGEGSINERMTIIHDVLDDVIKNKNYLGHGVGNVFQFLSNQHNTNGIYNPHCYPIEILSDFGIPGLLLYGVYYLYMLVVNIMLGIKKKNVYCFAAAAGLVAFAPASFGPSSITYVFSYWILVAFSVSCIQVAKNTEEYDSSSKIKEFKIN